MKLWRICLALLLVLAMVLPTVACSSDISGGGLGEYGEETETKKETVVEEKKPTEFGLYKNESKLKLLNERCVFTATGELATDWGGSGFEARILVDDTGTDLTLSTRSSYTTYWKLYIDGEVAQASIEIGSGRKNTVIATGLEPGEHTIRFVKESQIGTSTSGYNSLLSLTFFGEMLSADTAEKDLYIEFIGDGYFSGYGALGNMKGSKTIDTEISSTSALPYLVAEEMDADYSLVACSSIGMATAINKLTLPMIYSAQYGFRENTESLYTPDRTPDVIVLHVGIEDTLTDLAIGEFVRRGEDFIKLIRSYYGEDVPVVLLYGARSFAQRVPETLAIAEKMGGAAAGVYTLGLEYGANGSSGSDTQERFPSLEDNKKNLQTVVDFLNELLKTDEA